MTVMEGEVRVQEHEQVRRVGKRWGKRLKRHYRTHPNVEQAAKLERRQSFFSTETAPTYGLARLCLGVGHSKLN